MHRSFPPETADAGRHSKEDVVPRELPSRPDLEYYRKDARAFLRRFRAADPDAVARASAVLGERAPRRFLLSDAQHVVAAEHGHRSWAGFRRAVEASTPLRPAGGDRHDAVASALAAAGRAWGDVGEALLETGAEYLPDDPILVRVRKRRIRYTIDDDGAAVEKAGRPPGWLDVAERVVRESWLNVNRRGVVFVPAVEGRDLASLVLRIADTSRAVHAELLELDGG